MCKYFVIYEYQVNTTLLLIIINKFSHEILLCCWLAVFSPVLQPFSLFLNILCLKYINQLCFPINHQVGFFSGYSLFILVWGSWLMSKALTEQTQLTRKRHNDFYYVNLGKKKQEISPTVTPTSTTMNGAFLWAITVWAHKVVIVHTRPFH